jgi:hypothetical protein
MLDARQEQKMPETGKVSGSEEASSKTEEPGIGAKKVSDQLVEEPSNLIENSSAESLALSPGPEKASEELEGSNDRQPEDAEEKSSDTFVRDVADGLADAVETEENIDLNDGEDTSHEEKVRSDHEIEEGFFTGWDGFDEIHELSTDDELSADEEPVDDEEQTQPFEGEAGHRTLSEIALASGVLRTLDGSSEVGPGLFSKHDELAAAVEEALMSVYGEAPSDTPARRSTPSPDLHASGPGWASEDSLSPQDVILNYFDYQPDPGRGRGTISDHADAGYNSDTPHVFSQPHDYPPPQYRPQWASSPAARAEYDDREPYPEDHGAIPKSADASERESSRLLGAAAIGLVGGIAIAASLAVFVINSYGPGGHTAPGGTAQTSSDTSPAGYGRWIKSGSDLDPSKAGAVVALPDAPPVIAASDVLVMSGQPSPLAIKVKPEQANERTLISLTGIPEGARLNAGVDAGGGNWLLPPRRLDGLTINVPAGTPDTALLTVQVLDSNIRTPLSEQAQFSIRVATAKADPAAQTTIQPRTQPEIVAVKPPQPEPAFVPETRKSAKAGPTFFSTETVPTSASIEPQAEPQAKPANPGGAAQQTALRQAALQAPGTSTDQPKVAPKTEIEDLIREGNKRMREGDILEARQLYQKAVGLGDPEAALAMGRSYDPIYFARIDKKNAEPDAAKAFDWYRKAMDGGANQTAKVRIDNLKHFLNQ